MPPTESKLITDLKAAWKQVTGKDWDDCDLPRLVTIRGFLEKVSHGGVESYRIYLNHSMTSYHEVAKDAVIFSQPTGGADDPQRIWLKHGVETRLVTSRVGDAEPAPRLLDGPIVQGYMAGSPAGQAPLIPVYPPGYGIPPHGGGPWPDGEEGGWEASQCKNNCFSHSP